MITLLKLVPPKTSRLNNAEYINFMNRIYGMTLAGGAEALHYEQADIDRFALLLGDMQDLVARNMGSIETAEMQELEALRDEKGRYIIDTVRNSRNLPFEAIAAAANALWYVLKPYDGFHRLPNMQETATIEGMLVDLNKEENAAHVTTLSLTDSVAALATANSQYKILTDQRTQSRDAAKTADSKTLREEMDELYDYITTVAFAHNVVNPTDALKNYINNVNAVIAETNTAYNQRMAQAGQRDTDEAEG